MAYVGSVVFLGFFITIVIVANKANKTAYDKSMAAAWETGYRYSNEIKDMMTLPLDTSRALDLFFPASDRLVNHSPETVPMNY